MTARQPFPLAVGMRRLVASVAILLVLALGVLGASPELHAKIHGGHVGNDDGCPVAVFANGVSAPAGVFVAEPVRTEVDTEIAVIAEELFLTAPRYLRQPERGPPMLG